MSNKAAEAGSDAGAAGAAGTALGWAGLGLNVLNIGANLVGASEQRAAQREAQRQAEVSFKLQKQQQEQNFFEAMRIPTEAYDRALREGTAQQAQSVTALQEGDPRQLLGGVGKVQAATLDYDTQARDAMAKQMFDLQKLQAQEKMLTADDLAKMYESQVTGAQKAAAGADLATTQLLGGALQAGMNIATRIDAPRKEYKQQPVVSNTGANIAGLKSQQPNTFVDFNTGFSPSSLYANYSIQQPGKMPSQYSSVFPSVSSPYTGSMSATPQLQIDPITGAILY